MGKPEQVQSQTELEPKVGDRLYPKRPANISTGPSRAGSLIIALDRSWTITINKIMPDGAFECWVKDRDRAYCFPISQKDFKALPLGRDKREGPVSEEHPLGFERAAALTVGKAKMRSPEEEKIRDLILKASAEVHEKTFTDDRPYEAGE